MQIWVTLSLSAKHFFRGSFSRILVNLWQFVLKDHHTEETILLLLIFKKAQKIVQAFLTVLLNQNYFFRFLLVLLFTEICEVLTH